MGNRVFGLVVFLLWASSMSWLTLAKILPSYLHGDAPSSRSDDGHTPVAWEIVLNDDPCGFAVSQTVDGVDQVTEVHTLVSLERVSLGQIAPTWMQTLVTGIGDVRLEMRNKSTLDAFGNLSTIASRIAVNDIRDAALVDGQVQQGKLKLRVRSGAISRVLEYPWQAGELAGEFTPDAQNLRVHVGQTWRKEVYSPFGSPHDPVELLEARVVDEESIFFAGEVTRTRRVEYRTVSSAGVSSKNRLRSVVWVADDGRVLRQDAYLLNARLRFDRLSEEESSTLAERRLELDRHAALLTPKLETPSQPDRSP